MIFVDTSALIAVLDADERNHAGAVATWDHLLTDREVLITTNYVVVETMCLVQRRFGLAALRRFLADLVPLLAVEWITPDLHCAATAAVVTAGMRDLSVVDGTSFEVIRHKGIERAFTFDRHFADQGFEVVP